MKDNYGNKIEYDINSWIGEDNITNKEININNTKNDISVTGLINISLNNNLVIDSNASILLSIINENFEISDLYLYGKNNYIESYNLKCGNYDVLLVKNMATNEEYDTNIQSFQIKDGENINLLIIPKIEKIEETIIKTIETTTKATKKEISSMGSLLSVFIIFIIFAILFLISIILIKQKFRGEE